MGNRRFNQVIQHAEVWEQIEVLEHVADVDALAQNRLLFQFIQLIAALLIADVVAINLNKSFVDPFQMIDGAQQRGFTGAGRPEDHRDGPRCQ